MTQGPEGAPPVSGVEPGLDLLSLWLEGMRDIGGCNAVRYFRTGPDGGLTLAGVAGNFDGLGEPSVGPTPVDGWVARAFASRKLLQLDRLQLDRLQCDRPQLHRPQSPATGTAMDHESDGDVPQNAHGLSPDGVARVWIPAVDEHKICWGILECNDPGGAAKFSERELGPLIDAIPIFCRMLRALDPGSPVADASELYRCWLDLLAIRAASLARVSPKAGKDNAAGPTGSGRPPLHHKKSEEQRAHQYGEEKMAGIARLAAGIAHEINNPLAVAVANSGQYTGMLEDVDQSIQAAMDRLDAGDWAGARRVLLEANAQEWVAEAREMTSETREALARIAKVVGQMMRFGEKAPSRVEEVDLADEAQRAVELFRLGIFPGKGNPLTIELNSGQPVPIQACRNRIRQIFAELLENALRAAGQVEPTGGRVWVRVFAEAGKGTIEVADNGPGIDFESQQRIFDPFYTNKRNWRSTGLGLSAVYGIVQGMNGSITLQSSPGRGARFRIQLPARSPSSDAAQPAAAETHSGRYYEDLR